MSDLPPSDSEALGQGQLTNLRRLLGVALESNPFQQAKLGGTGLDESLESIDEFVSRCPFTTKDELARDRLENPPHGTNLSFPLERYLRLHQTSGTQGEPMAWLDVAEDWDWMLGNWDRVLETAEIPPGGSSYFAFSFGPFLGFQTGLAGLISGGYQQIFRRSSQHVFKRRGGLGEILLVKVRPTETVLRAREQFSLRLFLNQSL